MFDSSRQRRSTRLTLEHLEDRATPAVALPDVYSVVAGQNLTVPVGEGLLSNDFSTAFPPQQLQVLVDTLNFPPTVNPPDLDFFRDPLIINPDGSFTFLTPSNFPPGSSITYQYFAFNPLNPLDSNGNPVDPPSLSTATFNIVAPPTQLYAVAPDAGGGPHVRVFDESNGVERFSIMAFDAGFTGGVRVATGDITNDGIDDVVVGAGPGGGPVVKVFDGASGGELGAFFAYDPAFTGGVYVAVGDVQGDGFNEIIAGAGNGGSPLVRIYSGAALGGFITQFFAYEDSFRGGVQVASGRLESGVNRDAIITGSGPGGGPVVKVFDLVASGGGVSVTPDLAFFAYDVNSRGGVNVSAGDTSGDGLDEIITGQGSGTPQVNIHNGQNGALIRTFIAYTQDQPGGGSVIGGTGGIPGTNGGLLPPAQVPGALVPSVGFSVGGGGAIFGAGLGVRVATGDRNGDGIDDIITGPGPGQSPRVRTFSGTDLTELENLTAFTPAFLGGVFVG